MILLLDRRSECTCDIRQVLRNLKELREIHIRCTFTLWLDELLNQFEIAKCCANISILWQLRALLKIIPILVDLICLVLLQLALLGDLLEVDQGRFLLVLEVLGCLCLVQDLGVGGYLVVGDLLLWAGGVVGAGVDVVLSFNLLSVAALRLDLLKSVVGLILDRSLLDLLVVRRRLHVIVRLLQRLGVYNDLGSCLVRRAAVLPVDLLDIL